MKFLDFAGCAGNVEGLGPGRRAAMWVRGCPLACPGCMTPELWAGGPPGSFVPVEQVAALLRPFLAVADGLTISGGEPMEQAGSLRSLIRLLRGEWPNLEVLVYSGYRMEELETRGSEVRGFLDEIDILIDGRFEQTASNTLNWRGSDNQRVHLLSDLAHKHLTADEEWPEVRPLQVQMLGSEQFRIIGIPKRGDMVRYRKAMEQRGLMVKKAREG